MSNAREVDVRRAGEPATGREHAEPVLGAAVDAGDGEHRGDAIGRNRADAGDRDPDRVGIESHISESGRKSGPGPRVARAAAERGTRRSWRQARRRRRCDDSKVAPATAPAVPAMNARRPNRALVCGRSAGLPDVWLQRRRVGGSVDASMLRRRAPGPRDFEQRHRGRGCDVQRTHAARASGSTRPCRSARGSGGRSPCLRRPARGRSDRSPACRCRRCPDRHRRRVRRSRCRGPSAA